ncbi:YkgJ family cysteine cluster protein [Seleniivibrio woodruffii]|uniref:YkgJ family cysteine cluster protein n=1 Tax=Seleniivibrio woodruffii TaxID=1078050 RepID=UPI0026EDA65F|nr:YkgJ family cysteine cluster protein [Seleniivibrio woodruffii]
MAGIRIYDFHETVYLSVIGSVKAGESPAETMKRIHLLAQQRAAKDISGQEASHMQCRRGCSHCCRVHVPVLCLEADSIAEYLLSSLSEESLETLKSKLRYIKVHIAGYDEQERIVANIPCGFLGSEGECLIHSVRPLVCRSVTSADSEACRRAMTMSVCEENAFIPMNITHKSIYDSAFIGLADAMKEMKIDCRSFEITEAVLYRLNKQIE